MGELRPSVRAVSAGEAVEFLGPAASLHEADAANLEPAGASRANIDGVCLDSRRVEPGDLYAALPGFNTHGAAFAAGAVERGATAILTDAEGASRIADGGSPAGIPLIVIDDPRSVLGSLSAWIYEEPARALTTIGITGTNGKTTMAHLIEAGLQAAGRRTGVIGTVGTRIGDEYIPTNRTTPEAPDVHRLLAVMRQRGVQAVVMEVSSHALDLGRVDGIMFDHVVFTNLTQDHLDFHGSMEAYFEAKASLFTPARAHRGIVCTDDDWGRELLGRGGIPMESYGLRPPADWLAGGLVAHPDGSTTFSISSDNSSLDAAGVSLPGSYNVANALGAVATLIAAGVDPGEAAAGVESCPGVPGRMERVIAGQEFVAIVDYAHTPDAVERAIEATRENVSGRIITVVGCGGDRDADKRPLMGEVATRGSDLVVITDDNPRGESPPAIRAAMMSGARRVDGGEVLEIGDRRAAIRAAVAAASRGDAVLILGKGHEQGQEVAGVMHPFDDRVELRAAIEEASA